mgnify:CR=1 FL=1
MLISKTVNYNNTLKNKYMKSSLTKYHQPSMVVLLIICGGPIGKGNGKAIIQAEANNLSDKKLPKDNMKKGKKPSYSPDQNKL